MPKSKPSIKYTSRDYDTIRQELLDYARRYYGDTVQDFSQNSFASLMFDTVSYIGDTLSFYLDYQVNESFFDTANEYNNVVKLARQLGYKNKLAPSSTGIATFYISIPAAATGLGPDTRYIPTLLRNSEFATTNGVNFILAENVQFKNDNNLVIVSKIDDTTGLPTEYAIKANGRVISGANARKTFTIGAFERFRKVSIGSANVAEILSVVDAEGNEYYEVDSLSQNIVYAETTNPNALADGVPSLLKPLVVTRRFTVERTAADTILQFGHGSDDASNMNDDIFDPKNTILEMHAKNYFSDTEFDPNRLVENDKFGIGPSNTTLFVVYRNNFTNDVNAAVGSLSQITSTTFNFADQANLDTNTINTVQGSLEVDNEVPIIGGFSVPTAEEIRIKALNHFASQNRAVTKEDYKSFVYALPAKFGSIARCNIVRDANSTKRNLNLYVLTEDNNSFLIQANNTIKQNLKTWLSRVKMINDTIDILDANVVNIGIRFVILATQQENKYVALTDGVNAVKEKFNRKFEIGEPIYITDVMTALQAVPTIADVKKVTILNRVGGVYSDINYNIDLNKSADGRYITIPEDHVFEIKYPNADIIGTVL
jgi:hypothetical protein